MAAMRQFLSKSPPKPFSRSAISWFRGSLHVIQCFSSTLLNSDISIYEGLGFCMKFLATSYSGTGVRDISSICGSPRICLPQPNGSPSMVCRRNMATMGDAVELGSKGACSLPVDAPPRIKFKRLDKTSRHIMQILDKEAIKEVKEQREIPEIKPGYIIQLKLEVPENRRRVSTIKGIVIARRNAGLNTTIRLRRMVAGIGIESLLPLYSPNIKEVKVLEKKKVRRAKLYYLRDKMNEIRKLETLSPK